MMNVLLTCAGRRNYLVQFFKAALRPGEQVIACDSSASAPAFMEADQSFVVPSVDHPDYFDVLARICAEHEVGLLVPVLDLELPGLAQRADLFRAAGTIPLIAAPRAVATCLDKWAAFHYLKACNLGVPHTCNTVAAARQALASGALRFPLLIKPRWGVSSIGVELIENERELALAHEWGQVQMKRTILAKMCQADQEHSFIFQEWLRGQEFGLDIVNDLDGRYVTTLARRKLQMRAGNTDRAVSVSEPRFERLGKVIGKQLAHLGGLDCDVMATDDGLKVLDLNPRFGGGYPFSHLAGANLPGALVAWANGDEPDPAWLRSKPGVVSSKYDGLTIMNRTSLPTPVMRKRKRRTVASLARSASI
jgi:carbamoyl-phosphate synthase large subunit